MQHFNFEVPRVEGANASFVATNDIYRVTISVERKDQKQITKKEAELAYTQALQFFPTRKTIT
jgi:hypothetical protein